MDKYLDKSLTFAKYHLHQSYQDVRSTQSPTPSLEDIHPVQSSQSKQCFVKMKCLECVHPDQTGKFSYVSSSGFKYIMVLYAYDFNTILSTPHRSKSGSDKLASIRSIYDRLNSNQLIEIYFMNNENPRSATNYHKVSDISYQIFLPNIYHRNAVERTISTRKD